MLGNISGEGFEQWVYDQIKVRQKVYGSVNRTPEELLYLNGRTSWVRLISSVNFSNEPYYKNNEGTKKLQDIGLDGSSYIGDTLARQFVLFAGTSNYGGLRSGINFNENTGLDKTFNNAYGIGGNEFGIQPMPTLGDVEIKHRNRGSLKESNLTIKCFNKKQFEIIESLYLRLGYTVLLEWGNSCYFDNNGVFQKDNLTSLENYMFDNTKVQDGHFALLSEISKKREEAAGNYDAIYAKVSNYSWTFENGVYNISVKLMSLGDIVESLKVNFLSIPKRGGGASGTWSEEDEETDDEKSAEADTREYLANYKDKSDISRLFYNAAVASKNEKDVGKTVNDFARAFLYFQTYNFSGVKDIFKKYQFGELLKGGDGYQIVPFSSALKGLSHLSIDTNNFVNNNNAFLSVNYDTGYFDASSNVFYIQFGALLEFIEKTQLLYNSQKDSKERSSLISIDYNPLTNYMVSDGKMISTDPTKCLINPNIQNLGLYEHLPPFKFPINDKYNVGLLMNVYVNFRFILDKISELTDDKGNVSLFNLLKAICDGINYSLGNVNSLAPFYDEEFNSLKIIDEAVFQDNDKIIEYLRDGKPDITPLQLFGYDNLQETAMSSTSAGFVKSYGIKTSVTNDIATTIAIGAQAANKSIKGIDATAFSAWNRGLIDRIIPQKLELPDKKTKEDEDEKLPSTFEKYKEQLRQKYKDSINNYRELEQSFKGSTKQPDFNFEQIPAYNAALKGYRNYISELDSYEDLKKAEDGKLPPVTSPSFLPINLNLELDGFSGPLILQKLEVNTSFLPNPIPDTLSFLLKGISHSIKNNVWTTSYDTISIPKFLTAKKEDTTQTEKVSGEKPKTKTKTQPSNPEEDPAVIYFKNNKIADSKGYVKADLHFYGNGSKKLENKLTDFTKLYDGFNIQQGVIPKLHPTAASQLVLLYKAYKAQFGKGFTISSAFRTLAKQEELYQNPKSGGYKDKKGQWTGGGGWAATPGTSNHGFGAAIDIAELYRYVGGKTNPELNRQGRIKSPEYKWLAENGPTYGWYNPWKLCDYGGNDEMWHWEYLAGINPI